MNDEWGITHNNDWRMTNVELRVMKGKIFVLLKKYY